LIVDVQNDFCSGGALTVPNSDRIIASLNRYIDDAVANGVAVYASRDWHPAVSNHFAEYGGTWPTHCVRHTTGARFHPALHLPSTTIVVSKGEKPDAPGYSAFEGRTSDGTPLLEHLRHHGVTHLYLGGVATDYCVKASVLDAVSAGLTVTVFEDAIAGVDLRPGDSRAAVAEMRRRGARVTRGAASVFERQTAEPKQPLG
jgi:nicotinamidase/pyrazinamidase